jgi:hypothetical protein
LIPVCIAAESDSEFSGGNLLDSRPNSLMRREEDGDKRDE